MRPLFHIQGVLNDSGSEWSLTSMYSAFPRPILPCT